MSKIFAVRNAIFIIEESTSFKRLAIRKKIFNYGSKRPAATKKSVSSPKIDCSLSEKEMREKASGGKDDDFQRDSDGYKCRQIKSSSISQPTTLKNHIELGEYSHSFTSLRLAPYSTHSGTGLQNDKDSSNTNIIVKDLPQNMTDDDLDLMFKAIGPLQNSIIWRDKMTGNSLGFGFVNFVHPADALKAIETLSGSMVQDSIITIALTGRSGHHTKGTNLIIKGIPPSWKEADLNKMFEAYGKILQSRITIDLVTGLSKRVGYVCFETYEEALEAVRALSYKIPDGASDPIVVKILQDVKKRAEKPDPVHEVPGHSLMLKNLPQTLSDEEFRSLVESSVGPVESCLLMRDSSTGTSYGFGYVDLGQDVDITGAVQKLSELRVHCRSIQAEVCAPGSARRHDHTAEGCAEIEESSSAVPASDTDVPALEEKDEMTRQEKHVINEGHLLKEHKFEFKFEKSQSQLKGIELIAEQNQKLREEEEKQILNQHLNLPEAVVKEDNKHDEKYLTQNVEEELKEIVEELQGKSSHAQIKIKEQTSQFQKLQEEMQKQESLLKEYEDQLDEQELDKRQERSSVRRRLNVTVGNLPKTWKDSDVIRLLNSHGQVVKCLIKATGFVSVSLDNETRRLVESMDGTVPDGASKPIKVKIEESNKRKWKRDELSFLDRPREVKVKAKSQKAPQSRSVIVKSLPMMMTDKELKSIVEKIGPVKDCEIKRDRTTGVSYGFGLVKFKYTDDAEKAVEVLSGHQIENHTLKLSFLDSTDQSLLEGSADNTVMQQSEPNEVNTSQLTFVFKNIPSEWEVKELENLIKSQSQTLEVMDSYVTKTAYVYVDAPYEAELAISGLNKTFPDGASEAITVKISSNSSEKLQLQEDRYQEDLPGKQQSSGVSTTSLIIHQLPDSMTEEEFLAMFTYIGPIKKGSGIVRDKVTGESQCYGFVHFEQTSDAAYAVRLLSGKSVQNRTLKVSFARESGDQSHDSSCVLDKDMSDSTNLIVKNFPKTMKEKDFEAMFTKIGPVTDYKLWTNKKTGETKDFGFVTFLHQKDAQQAIRKLSGIKIDSKKLTVKFSRQKKKQSAQNIDKNDANS